MANSALCGLLVVLIIGSCTGFNADERRHEKRFFLHSIAKGMKDMITGMASGAAGMMSGAAHGMDGVLEAVTGKCVLCDKNKDVPLMFNFDGLQNLNHQKATPKPAAPVAAKTECMDRPGIDCSIMISSVQICKQPIASKYCPKTCKFC